MTFISEVIIMFRYFLKVQITQWIYFTYSILLPLTMIIPKLSINGDASEPKIIATMLPWIGFLTLNNAITANADVIALREQGYLKQYKTLVTSLTVFTFSKQLVWFFMQTIEIFLISIVCAVLYQMNIVLLVPFFGASIMTYPILVSLCQLLILLPINSKALTVINYIFFAIAFFLAFSASKLWHLPLWSNPINLFSFCYNLIAMPRWLPILGYLGLLLSSLISGRLFLGFVNTAPVERS